jgi:hypothetical protein
MPHRPSKKKKKKLTPFLTSIIRPTLGVIQRPYCYKK